MGDVPEMTIPAAAADLGITSSALYAAIERKEVRAVERLGKLGITESERVRFKSILAGRKRRGPKVGAAKNGSRKPPKARK